MANSFSFPCACKKLCFLSLFFWFYVLICLFDLWGDGVTMANNGYKYVVEMFHPKVKRAWVWGRKVG
jgi:hypothetical protein